MNPRLILARRRAGLHPGYVRAVESKPQLPAEVYAYPALARRDAGWRQPRLPITPAPTRTPSLRGLAAIYVIGGLALWCAAAIIPTH